MEIAIPGISFEVAIILSVMVIIIIIQLIINLSNKKKINQLKAKYDRFMGGLSERNMEQLLDDYINTVRQVSAKNRDIENQINDIQRTLLQCVQKVSVVRYNAFDNIGSDMSFSIAMMDNNDNGLVISGIYSRDSSSAYAKPLSGGKSKYILSTEEIQAVENAKKSYTGRLYS